MDTANHFKVRSPDGGRTLYFDTNTPSPILVKLTPEQALNLAAWLLTIAEPNIHGPADCIRFLEEIRR